MIKCVNFHSGHYLLSSLKWISRLYGQEIFTWTRKGRKQLFQHYFPFSILLSDYLVPSSTFTIWQENQKILNTLHIQWIPVVVRDKFHLHDELTDVAMWLAFWFALSAIARPPPSPTHCWSRPKWLVITISSPHCTPDHNGYRLGFYNIWSVRTPVTTEIFFRTLFFSVSARVILLCLSIFINMDF
jgi:hypothetical protein